MKNLTIRAPKLRIYEIDPTLMIWICFWLSFLSLLTPYDSLKAEVTLDKERIAVLDFRDEANLAPFERALLADSVRGAALNTPFDVMTKENITALLPPDVELEDCVGECEVDVGRQIGAHYVVTGVVGRVSGELRLLLRLYETRLGALRAQAEARALSVGALQPQAHASAIKLFTQLAPTQSVSAKTLLWVKVTPTDAKISLDGFPLDLSQARPVRGEAGGMIWPISSGRHVVKAQAPGYLVEQRIIKVIEGQPVEALFKLKRRTGTQMCRTSTCQGDVWVYTRPPGAEISVLGQTKTYITAPNSMNPRLGSVALRLPEGKHWIKAKLGGRQAERLVTVQGGEANLEMKDKPMLLRKKSARFTLETSPSGALVRLNGEVIGKTPIRKKKLNPGAYWVEVVAEGRQSKEKLIVLDDQSHWRESWKLIVNTSSLVMRVSFKGAPISGASIWFGGQRLGATDKDGQLLAKGLPIGEHFIEVRHPHYMPYQRMVNFKAGTEQTSRISLEGAWSELSLSLNEMGLKDLSQYYQQKNGQKLTFTAIWAGKELGELPIKNARVRAGKHWLQVRASDERLFEPYREQITLEIGSQHQEQITLKSLKGDLDLASSPPNARIMIDGQAQGKTPYRGRLTTGLHQVTLEVDDFPPYHKTVLLQSDGYQESIDFRKRTYIQVQCDPLKGEVTINGLLRGPSPQLVDLVPGTHEIECQLYGASVSAPIKLSSGEQLTQHLTLSSTSINFARWRKKWTPHIGKGLIGLGALSVLSSLVLWLGPQRNAESERDMLAQSWLEARTPQEISTRYRAWSQARQEAYDYYTLTQLSLWGGLSFGAGGGILWWSNQANSNFQSIESKATMKIYD